MDDQRSEGLGKPSGGNWPQMSRRRYLGLAGGAGAVGGAGWLSRWTGRAADPGEPSFELRSAWRETLPAADWSDANRLPLVEESFEDPAAVDRWRPYRLAGPAQSMSVEDDRLMVRGQAEGSTTTVLTTPVPVTAPWVAVAATVTAVPSSGLAGVGFAKGTDDAVYAGIGPDGPELRRRIDGHETSVDGEGGLPEPPFEAMTILMGDRFALMTRPPEGEWAYQGHLGWSSRRGGVDLFDRGEWARWDPGLVVATGPSERASFADVRVFHTLQFGVRDPTVVTRPDGTPLIRNGELYLTVTCGSIDHRGYQAVLALDVETYDVTFEAALWAESVPGYVSNYVASHLVYDDDRDGFIQCWSGFGNGDREPYGGQKCWLSRTDADLLTGTHVLDCELMHLPWGWSGRQHDPFVIRDPTTGTWRCIHASESIHRVTVSETDDERLTSGWKPVASYRDLFNQIEGGKLARIGDEIVLSYADQGSPSNMVTAAYPDPGRDRRWIDVDVSTEDVAPHPSLVAVPTDAGEKLLLVTMSGETAYGLGEPTHGALYVYEAAEAGGS